MDILKGEGSPQILERLASFPDMIALADLQAAGVDIAFDKQQIALVMGLTAGQRKTGDLSFAPPPPVRSGAEVAPAFVSGYLNLFGASAYRWQSGQTALWFDAEVAMRVGGLVLETEMVLENGVDAQLCPPGALCLFDHTGGVKRRGSRAVYDVPEWQDRIIAGDTRTLTTTFQRGPDVAGLSIEHAPGKLDPTSRIRATGAQSFTIERAGTVDVLINGAVSQRLNLPPGQYNLRDLPLRVGANEITLLITDDTGASRTLTFDTFSSNSLLAVSKSEWSATAGAPSYLRDGEVTYAGNRFLSSGFYRYGLADAVTLEAHAQADNNVLMGGGGGIFASPFGLWGLNIASSLTNGGIGTGGAFRLTWDLASKDLREGFRLAGEWHTAGFRTPGQLHNLASGVILPVYDAKASYFAAYTRELWDRWQGAWTARYDVANDRFVTSNPLVARGDRYHFDFSLTRAIFDTATISATIGYSNEIYARSFSSSARTGLNDTQGELWAGVRLFWRPDEKVIVTASSETLTQRSVVTGSTHATSGTDAWFTTVQVADDRASQQTSTGGSVTYRGQRAEVTVGHDSQVRTRNLAASGIAPGEQHSRVRVGTAIVVADGAVALSAPVRGDGGFAILQPHASIGDRTVVSGTAENPRARSDLTGPAVVNGLAAYAPQTVPVDVDDLPAGYSLGSSGFDVRPPYKAGYRLEVGSSYSVSAMGELRDGRGDPLALVAGVASNGSKQITVFTNHGGKFAADGLAPGNWTLTMEGEDGRLVYRIVVPASTQGLVRLGTLTPAKE